MKFIGLILGFIFCIVAGGMGRYFGGGGGAWAVVLGEIAMGLILFSSI